MIHFGNHFLFSFPAKDQAQVSDELLEKLKNDLRISINDAEFDGNHENEFNDLLTVSTPELTVFAKLTEDTLSLNTSQDEDELYWDKPLLINALKKIKMPQSLIDQVAQKLDQLIKPLKKFDLQDTDTQKTPSRIAPKPVPKVNDRGFIEASPPKKLTPQSAKTNVPKTNKAPSVFIDIEAERILQLEQKQRYSEVLPLVSALISGGRDLAELKDKPETVESLLRVLILNKEARKFNAFSQALAKQDIPVNITQLTLANSDLKGFNFNGAHFKDVVIKDAETSSLFEHCNFENVTFLRCKSFDTLRKSTFKNCLFMETQFNNTDFITCEIKNTAFTECTFSTSNMASTIISNSKLKKCTFKNSLFQSTKFNQVNFSDCLMDSGNYRFTELAHCSFYKSVLKNIHFSQGKLINNQFMNSKIIKMKTDQTLLMDNKQLPFMLNNKQKIQVLLP